jgi:hypothetical protein
MCYWETELGESYQGLLEFNSSRCAGNSIMMTPTHRFFPCQTRQKKFSLKKTLVPYMRHSLSTTVGLQEEEKKVKKKEEKGATSTGLMSLQITAECRKFRE